MKRIFSFMAILALCANSAKAQLTVYSNGRVGIGTGSTTPESTISIKGGNEGYDASVIGTRRGIYGASYGQYLNWAYGVYGKNYCTTTSFQCGTCGIAELKTPQSSCRTYGIIGIAGNATNGWNYGVYGQLNGVNNGAGVYGTATSRENGSCVDGRYAGYFNGATKVKGNLTVTGTISGVLLNQVSNTAAANSLSGEYDEVSVTDRLSKLSATCYYTDVAERLTEVRENTSDSISVNALTNETKCIAEDRMHYGLDISQLKESFPELVYEQADGTVGVNYIEIIPLLVQEINKLRTEITALKVSKSLPYSDNSGTTSSTVTLSTDGKIIVGKRNVSK